MTNSIRRGSAIALGLIGAALAANAGFANSSSPTTQCGIATSTEGGMLALEGTILSPVAVNGEYRFAIQSSSNGGSSNISQGGYFSANANEATSLGKVMLNVGTRYDVTFDVSVGDKKIECNQDIASQL